MTKTAMPWTRRRRRRIETNGSKLRTHKICNYFFAAREELLFFRDLAGAEGDLGFVRVAAVGTRERDFLRDLQATDFLIGDVHGEIGGIGCGLPAVGGLISGKNAALRNFAERRFKRGFKVGTLHQLAGDGVV